jgi:DNA polymerase III delta subunit
MEDITAVEWYSNKLLEILGESVNNFTTQQTMANHYALKQAKEMEKKQIIDAMDICQRTDFYVKYESSEQYYNETYKNK